ncbi:MAG: glycosyltransferase [Planctomycetes bacterium]|nr:glycosyltransferase [Planctomycetota bacterium]
MSSLRALHVSTNPEMGGGEKQLLALVAGSASRGVEAHLLARARGKCLAAALAAGLRAEPLRAAFAYDPIAIARLTRRLRHERYDVVHLHDGGAASLGTAAAEMAGVPAIVHRRIASPLRRNALTRWKYDGRRVARFVAVSEVVAAVLAEGGVPRERIAVVPSGVDLRRLDGLSREAARRALEAPPDQILVGTIGKLAAKKGVDTVLRAFSHLGRELPSARCVVIGDGPDSAALRALAASLPCGERVAFLGERPDAATLLAGIDLFLFGSELEGAPGVVREAMALRVPVAAVDAPGTVEVLGETGSIVRRGDDDGLAHAALAALRRPIAERDAAVAAARARIEARYSIDSMIDGTIAVARAVVTERRATL